jgi:MFS family permease
MTETVDRARHNGVGEGAGTEAPAKRPPLLRAPGDGRALGVMTFGHAVQHFYVAGLAVAYPFVVADLHVSYGLLGVVLTVAGLAGGLLQGAAGFLGRARARVVLAGQNAGLAVSTLLGALAPGFGAFAGARVLGALVSWPQHPVGSAYLSERFPHRRATVLSWHVAGGSIGTVTVPLLVSGIIATAGWRWALVGLAAALALGAVAVGAALPSERITGDGATGRGAVPGEGLDHYGAAGGDRAAEHEHRAAEREEPISAPQLRQLLRRREVLAVLVASTVAAGGRGLGTLSTYVPADLRSGLHLPTITVGTIFTAVMASSVAGPLAGGALADRFGRRRALIVTYVAGAVAITAFGYVGKDVAALAVTGVAMGLLAYTESPLLQALFSDMTAAGEARSAFGAFFAIAYGVGSLWTALLGWVIDTAGFPVAFAVMAGSFVLAAMTVAVGTRAAPLRGRC